MRTNTNTVYKDGVIVEQTVTPWTQADYLDALMFADPAEKEQLELEIAVLDGIPAMQAKIDQVADAKRLQFLGDVTRTFEYQAAEEAAKAYQAAGFTGDVPDDVMSWAIADSLTPEEAALSILKEAFIFNQARSAIRAIRLAGKKALTPDKTTEQLEVIFFDAVNKLKAIGE